MITSTNIKNAQVKQQRDYKCSHQSVYSQLNIDYKVLLQNQKRPGRKGEKYKFKYKLALWLT